MGVIIAVLLLFVIGLQYFLSVYSIINRRYNLFGIVYLYSIVLYDFIYINAYYHLPSLLVAVLKPYNEYMTVILTLRLIISSIQHKKSSVKNIDKMMLYLIGGSLLILLFNDFATKIDLGATIAGLRIFLLPVIIPYLMLRANWLKYISERKLLYALFAITVVIVLYAIVQKSEFNGDIRSLWFYEFFKQYPENPIDEGPYNFIRNDVLRSTSLFVSPIIYSLAVAFPTIFLISLILFKSKILSRATAGILAMIFIYGLIIAETRVGLVIIAIGTAILLIPRFVKVRYAYKLMVSVPILAVIVTFWTLISGYTDDLSALGRLTQYASFFDYFKLLGVGFYSELVQTKFDAYYMSLALLYGIFIVLPIYFYISINKTVYKTVLLNDGGDNIFSKAVLTISLTFIYSFAFQFSAGAYPYRLLFFLVFLVISKFNNEKKNQHNNRSSFVPN